MKPIVTFFGTQPYEQESFDALNRDFGFEFRYFKGHLSRQTVVATHGAQAACIFVNDTADAEVMRELARNGVRLLALRCAGYNNVDLEAARTFNIPVVRVPAYSPHAVAEYTVAMMLSLNRKIPRASWRTRDGNFSLQGLMGFDMNGKTVGVIGTGKIARIVIRILLGNLASGQVMALLYSLGGGLLSFAGMALLCRILTAKQVWAAGAAGGLLHNLGQMAVALAVTRTPGLLVWLPVLLLCGLGTGLFTGLCAQLLLRRRLISDKGYTHDESQKK